MRFSKKSALKGFSLGEVLLASFVLTAGLMTVTALIATSMRQSLESRDAVSAIELAQEGVELVRNLRDNNIAAGNSAFRYFSTDKHCRRDYDDPSTSLNCNGSQGAASRYTLRYSGGAYEHADTASERFSRYIHINYNGTDTAVVRSFVYWGTFAPPASGNVSSCTLSNECVFTEANLTNWK